MKENNPIDNIRTQAYDSLKKWDKKREKQLKRHLQLVQEICENLQAKIQDSNQYLESIQEIFKNRLKQLKTYAAKSLQNSQFVLQKNNYSAYQAHYNLLKSVVMNESTKTEEVNEKIGKLRLIYQRLSGFKEQQLSAEKKNDKNDESSIILAKGNIRYIIECQLDQIVESVVGSCEKINKIFHNEDKEDLYLAILAFMKEARKQQAKHRQIGKQLIDLVATSLKRELRTLKKIKQCLKDWVAIDCSVQEVFLEQLEKKDDNPLIRDYYDISSMTDIYIEGMQTQQFLTGFQIDDFEDIQKLKLCELDGFFNKKIQANVVMTVDKYVHLLRLNSLSPDFSFTLNAGLTFKKVGECTVEVVQYRKKFYFKKQKQFDFELEFNNVADLTHFENFALKISDCEFV